MSEEKRINSAVLRAAAILLAAIVFSTVPTSGTFAATHKGSGGSSSASEDEATSPQVAEFIALLGDPKVQKWLEEQQHAAKASRKPAPHEETVSEYIDSRVGAPENTSAPSSPRSPVCRASSSRPSGSSGQRFQLGGP
jgi:hypothetical protein